MLTKRVIETKCPTCGTKLPDYPEAGWQCKCGRCTCMYMGGRYVGYIADEKKC